MANMDKSMTIKTGFGISFSTIHYTITNEFSSIADAAASRNDTTAMEKSLNTTEVTSSLSNAVVDKQVPVVDTSTESKGTTGRDSKLGSQHRTKIKSPSKSAFSPDAFQQTNYHLRSILMHPMGLPLAVYLNNIPRNPENLDNDDMLPEYIWAALDDYSDRCKDNGKWRDNVFAATALDWNGGEKDFTKKLLLNIKHCKVGDAQLTTIGEKKITGSRGETAIVDFIFHENELGNNGKTSVIGLFEFGLESKMWWTKQHQMLMYVNMLLAGNDPNYKIDQPILLSVITISQDKSIINDKCKKSRMEKVSDALSEAETEACKQERIKLLKKHLRSITSSKRLDTEKIKFVARFGVFLCIPKKNNQFRLALLWRHDSNTLRDACTQFGKILYTVQLCSNLRKPLNLNKIMKEYTYLGPNCCKFGSKVSSSFIFK
jgi:hypothetical protein